MENAKYSGVILYDGPSVLDGTPIVCIATLKSTNVKTGDMVQTWILLRDVNPTTALKSGQDKSICGDCRHRNTSCYVNVGRAPLSVYTAYNRGRYPLIDTSGYNIFQNRSVRIGAYGDPAAVPIDIWEKVSASAAATTGYTHQWRRYPELKPYCMASVDSLAERHIAKLLGWRTFRTSRNTVKHHNESICPASEQAGYKLNCNTCLACDGTASQRRGDITIQIHGSRARVNAFNSLNDCPEPDWLGQTGFSHTGHS